jgi:APA family basic amino acid/polyamine antiporter
VPGYPWTPALFIAAAAAVVGNTVIARPMQALIGLGIVATGLPAFFAWRAYFAWKKRTQLERAVEGRTIFPR